mmetsp:Transcript_14092/g.30294  ORF Transcript_14092/g.30294 Transcript_14092/m.30294 type:complete len:95 (-) Transcript_14092:47-331(-)
MGDTSRRYLLCRESRCLLRDERRGYNEYHFCCLDSDRGAHRSFSSFPRTFILLFIKECFKTGLLELASLCSDNYVAIENNAYGSTLTCLERRSR